MEGKTNFYLLSVSDQLVELILEVCGKRDEKSPKFPRVLYDTYVNKIILIALRIQEISIYLTSEKLEDNFDRYQTELELKAIQLNHLLRIAYEKKWINDSQRERLILLINKLTGQGSEK